MCGHRVAANPDSNQTRFSGAREQCGVKGVLEELRTNMEVVHVAGRIVRSKTAERVTELLGSREGRKHLSQYGWVEGMPVVMSESQEALEDVMALLSVHGRAVLVAMLDPRSADPLFLHVSAPNPALSIVNSVAQGTSIGALFEAAEHEGMMTFRVKYWKYSAVAHLIPAYRATATEAQLSYRN